MATKQEALRVAARFGFVLDESVTGKAGIWFSATFDHPTHSLDGDCRSIHEEDLSASVVWADCIDRMKAEGQRLERCTDPDCEYHEEQECVGRSPK